VDDLARQTMEIIVAHTVQDPLVVMMPHVVAALRGQWYYA